MRGINVHRNRHRRHVVRGVAFGLQTAVLGDADVVAVHRHHKAVEAMETAKNVYRQLDHALRAAIDRKVFRHHDRADRVAAVCVGEDRDGIRCVERVVAEVAVGNRYRHTIACCLDTCLIHRHIGHSIERAAVLVNGGGLLQEVVERTAHHTIGIGERRGIVEQVLRHGQILVHIGNIVHILVPHLAGGRPRNTGGFEDVQVCLIGMS